MARKSKEEAQETRNRLLASALDIMSEKPFSKVSMSEIAQNVGFSKGAMYWHFKNKEDLLIHLLKTSVQDEKGLWPEGRIPGSLDEIGLYFRDKMEKALKNDHFKKIYRVMQRRNEWPETVRRKIVEMMHSEMERERRMVEKVLAEARGNAGKEISLKERSSLITAVFHGLFISQLEKTYSIDLAKQTCFIVTTLAMN